jgi:hypothetical protein
VEFLALPFGSGAGNADLIEAAAKAGYKGIRSSDSRVVPVDRLDFSRLPGIYVDNASADKIAEKIWSMAGR